MLLTYVNRRKRACESQWGFAMIMVLQSIALTLMMVLSRFLAPDDSGIRGNFFLAVVEWSNVAIILVLTIHCTFTAQDVGKYGVGILDISAASFSAESKKDVAWVWYVSAYDVSLACAILYLSTLAVSCAAGLYFGYLPKVEGELWFISDMWVNI